MGTLEGAIRFLGPVGSAVVVLLIGCVLLLVLVQALAPRRGVR